MSKKESNFMPVGTVRPPAPITTDNSAVIATLEKRVEELEYYNLGLANESCAQQSRIRELEAVAEEAESLFRMYGHQDWCLEFTDLEQFLLAAGYLNE